MKPKDEIAKEFRKRKGISSSGMSNQWQNTRDCQSFYAGNFMSYVDSIAMTDGRGNRRNAMVQFNMVKPYVNAVRGFMAQNRRNADYVAKLDEDQGQVMYTEYINALKDSVRDKANADQIETQQDGDLLICGYGAVETAMSYGEGYASTSPNGNIIMGRIDPRLIAWDTTARQTNLLDSRWVYYPKVYDCEEAENLFNDAEEEDFEGTGEENQGNKVFYPRGGRYNKIQELYDFEDEDENLIKVYFYQWYEIEKFYRAPNPVLEIEDPITRAYFDAEMQEIAAEQELDDDYAFDPRDEIISCDAKTKKLIEELFEDIDFTPFNRRVYYTAVISGKKVFTAYRSPCQQGFTIKFKTGDFDENAKIWTGMVNSLKEPALYYNKALSELMFTIASQAKGGTYVERSAVDDINDFEAKYAKTDAVIIVEDGALSGNKIAPKKEQYSATGIEQIIGLSESALPMVSGIDKNFLGSSENKMETASLQRQRIRQVTTTLATYFDAGTLYQKEQAELLLPFMRILAENNDGTMFKAMTSDGSIENMRLSLDNFADDYYITIQEAPDTATQKEDRAELLFGMATQLLQFDPNTAKTIMSVGVKYTNLDLEDQQTLTRTLSPEENPIDPQYVQQLEAQVQQLTSEAADAQLKKTLSESSKNLATVEKIIADINKVNADTEQTEIENAIVTANPTQDVRVSV